MSTDTFFDYMMVGKKGVKMPRGDKKIIPNFEIPIPSTDIQKKIADECMKTDEECEKFRGIILRNSQKIAEIINTAKGTYNKIVAVCDINTETTNPSTNPDKKYIYIDIDAVENGTGLIDATKHVLGRTAPSRARRLAHSQSTIISTVRPHLKGFTFIEKEIENSVFSTGFAILTSKDVVKLPNKIIYYQFMYSDRLMNQMIAAMPKGSYPSINCDNIKNFEILTDIANVDKVLSKLNKLDKEIKDAHIGISHSIEIKNAILDKYLK